MARQELDSWPADSPLESAGCCGVIARLLGMTLLLVALGAMALYLLANPSEKWEGIADASAHPLALVTDPLRPLTVYAGTEQGSILVSRDGGGRWDTYTRGLPASAPVTALAAVPGGATLFAGTGKGVYVSTDGGRTWRLAAPGIPPHTNIDAVATLPDGTALAGATSRGVYRLAPGGWIWLESAQGLPPQSDIYAFLPLARRGYVLAALISGGVYASEDGGLTWTERGTGMSDAPTLNVFSLVAIPGANGVDSVLLAGTSHGVYASHDLGATWTQGGAGIGAIRVVCLTRDPWAPTHVVAGADTGVYQSTNGGATWRKVGFGLPADQHVGAVAVTRSPNGATVMLASVDRVYRFPGEWPLVAQPWRGIGFGALLVAALALAAAAVRWVRVAITV